MTHSRIIRQFSYPLTRRTTYARPAPVQLSSRTKRIQRRRGGVVSFIDPEVDPQTGTARLRADIPNPEGKLAPGLFVNVTLSGLERRGAIVVPQRSVLQAPTGRLVNYATINLVDALKRVPGVGDVSVYGAGAYAMRVWLRPDLMAQKQVTEGDVAWALQK